MPGRYPLGGLIERTFEAAVLLLEVCHHFAVPVAVWSFAEDYRRELGWEPPLSTEGSSPFHGYRAPFGTVTVSPEAPRSDRRTSWWSSKTGSRMPSP